MKFTRKKDSMNSIVKVWSNDKSTCWGIVGTIEDLLEENILEYYEGDHSLYLFLTTPEINQRFGVSDHLGKTRDEAIELVPWC